ncbi:MAG: hypothetical protein GY788_14770 [bacterium]|nr:hypothetical protein [bacterium]
MSREVEFEKFVVDAGVGLQRALVAAFGPEYGAEAVADALAYGWEHWDRIGGMENPAGYLYRVGYRNAVRSKRRSTLVGFPPVSESRGVWVEPTLPAALGRLSKRQRSAVVLVEAYGWTYQEVADLLGVSRGAVQSYVRRGLRKLRSALEVSSDV